MYTRARSSTRLSRLSKEAAPIIIDVHAHMGWDYVFDEDFTLQEQLDKHRQFGIAKTIVQPASCHDLERVQAQHDAIAQLSRQYPGEFYGMANPNPHLRDDVYESELRRCVEELGFVGVKIHTFAHAVHPGGRDGTKVMELARKLNIPVMVHTGAGIPFANPSNLIAVAERFPDVNIVIAHCGMMVMAGETILAMQRCPNLYADITWTGGFLIRHWVHELGANRFLFGTDHADNTGTELAKLQTCGLTEDEQEWIRYKSAQAIYSL
ncbi:amidohydrolase family protein [Paenibacillus sp. GCM10023252]|uniref:amidohydrolase family protein n=1 Tax=Paenibacillus sp. GCM10023252 TaxID=3252649 RepID=UPI003623B81D